MRRFAPILAILGLVIIGVVFYTFKQNELPPEVPPQPVETAQPPPMASEPGEKSVPEPAEPVEIPETPLAHQPVTDDNWAEKLDEILSTDKIDEDVKADQIADMIPKVSEPAQKELAEHLVNLVPTEGYEKAAAILTSEKTPADVSQVLLNDLFNRDHSLGLPLLLAVAKNQEHPLKDEAKQMLEMVIQVDHGTNWAAWGEAIEKTLKGEAP